MNREIEELESQLRTALQAKSQAVTAPMLRRPPIVAGTELSPSDGGPRVTGGDLTEPEFDPNRSEVHLLDLAALTASEPGRRRQTRWLAPALAAAAVIALAVGAAAAVNASRTRHPAPNPPATGVHTLVPSPSRPAPTPSASATRSGPAAAQYLGGGKTGSRDQVPWPIVGAGWRLVQPAAAAGRATLYLYDPAGGRYLITDQLPAKATVAGWSPDGARAMLVGAASSGDQLVHFDQLELASGEVLPGFTQFQGSFAGYTQPRGLAVLVAGQVQGASRLLRYGTDGGLQLAYPTDLAGVGRLYPATALYTLDGGAFVANTESGAALISNAGALIRRYPVPAGTNVSCTASKWWTHGTFIEACARQDQHGEYFSLYLQPAAGGTPTRLAGVDPSSAPEGYNSAWPLSNGDVLLMAATSCGPGSGYRILRQDGSIVGLILPSGVEAPAYILSMQADLATFEIRTGSSRGCGAPQLHPQPTSYSLLDYNMVTGQTRQLLDSSAAIVNYPGS